MTDTPTPQDGDDHPCLPLIVIGEVAGGGLEARCGNCGTYQPIGSGGEMSLDELNAFLAEHCPPDKAAPSTQPATPDDVYQQAAQAWFNAWAAKHGYPEPTGDVPVRKLADDPALRAAVDAGREDLIRQLADERRKVEVLLNGDKALGTRIWLGEEVARLKAEMAETRHRAGVLDGLLGRIVDNDEQPCRLNEGYCQTHRHYQPCAIAEARQLLDTANNNQLTQRGQSNPCTTTPTSSPKSPSDSDSSGHSAPGSGHSPTPGHGE